jgi:polyhydroxyalkanoate synthase
VEQNAGHQDEHTASQFVNCWSETVRQAADDTKAMLGGRTADLDPRAMQQQWFDTLSRSTDACFRSPWFLQSLSGYLTTLVAGQQAPAATASTMPETSGNAVLQCDADELQQELQQLEQQLSPAPDQTSPEAAKATALPQNSQSSANSWVTPAEVVYQEGTLKLLRFRNDQVRFREPVLICFALVNRPYILDLDHERSVVQRLLQHGFDVYLIDWGTPRATDANLGLDDYINGLLERSAKFVCAQTDSARLNLLGYCMGGTLATIYTAIHPERVHNLILMAAPVDFSTDEGLLNLWARPDYFDVDKLIDTFGNCPGEFLRLVFQIMKPVQNFAEKHFRVCERLNDTEFLSHFAAVERWANDCVPVAGRAFREYVKQLYQQNQLILGQFQLGDVPVRLNRIRCPVLLLVAERDHLVPPSSTLALERVIDSEVVETMTVKTGHVGLAVSTRSHRNLWPPAVSWIAHNSTPDTRAAELVVRDRYQQLNCGDPGDVQHRRSSRCD